MGDACKEGSKRSHALYLIVEQCQNDMAVWCLQTKMLALLGKEGHPMSSKKNLHFTQNNSLPIPTEVS